jgi:hypothetical protein
LLLSRYVNSYAFQKSTPKESELSALGIGSNVLKDAAA